MDHRDKESRSVTEEKRVDIMKLDYADDYGSLINRRSTWRGVSKVSIVQYARFLAILLILESMMIDFYCRYDWGWFFGISAGFLLVFILGIRVLESFIKAVAMVCCSVGIIALYYYLR